MLNKTNDYQSHQALVIRADERKQWAAALARPVARPAAKRNTRVLQRLFSFLSR